MWMGLLHHIKGCVILPVSQGIFDVVGSSVDKHSTLVPSSTLHAYVLVDSTQVVQLTIANNNA